MANLPVTIFKFAMSPFSNWQQMAWAGVFIITIGVLTLNILARVLFRRSIRSDDGRRDQRAETERKSEDEGS